MQQLIDIIKEKLMDQNTTSNEIFKKYTLIV